VLDQGPYSSCVAHAAMQCVRARHSHLGVRNAQLGSRWFTYYLARAASGDQHRDDGTYLRAAFNALKKFGVPPETEWPYEDQRDGKPMFACMPSVHAFFAAADQRSPLAYYRCTAVGHARVVEVKRAIASGHCVAFGTLVTEAFCDGAHGERFLGLPQSGEPIAGGHAMCLAAYDERGFSGPNSWGTSWGDKGWFHFRDEVIAWTESDDFWVVENVPHFPEAA